MRHPATAPLSTKSTVTPVVDTTAASGFTSHPDTPSRQCTLQCGLRNSNGSSGGRRERLIKALDESRSAEKAIIGAEGRNDNEETDRIVDLLQRTPVDAVR